MEATGLAGWLVGGIAWGNLSSLMVLVVFGAVALIMSNFLSNTVTASLLIPLALTLVTSGALEGVFGMLMVGLVIALSASFAMILPISTPPNAIAESTGVLKTKHMLLSGSIIGIIGLTLVLLLSVFYWPNVI
jgi:sodium-dependent dicarboxylate transporter 2/3/5